MHARMLLRIFPREKNSFEFFLSNSTIHDIRDFATTVLSFFTCFFISHNNSLLHYLCISRNGWFFLNIASICGCSFRPREGERIAPLIFLFQRFYYTDIEIYNNKICERTKYCPRLVRWGSWSWGRGEKQNGITEEKEKRGRERELSAIYAPPPPR